MYVDVVQYVGCREPAVADDNIDVSVDSVSDDGRVTVSINTYDLYV